MRVVLDTNILLSALMTRGTPPDQIYEEWRQGRFDLVSTERQIDELRAVSLRPFFQARLKGSEIGRMINDIRRLAAIYDDLPDVRRSPRSKSDGNRLSGCARYGRCQPASRRRVGMGSRKCRSAVDHDSDNFAR